MLTKLPYKGICNECKKEKWIVVRRGLCMQCNSDSKSTRLPVPNNNNGKTKGSIRRTGTWRNTTRYKKSHSFQTKKKSAFKNRKPIQYRRKPTGEKAFFQKIIEEIGEEIFTCRCCSTIIGTSSSLRPINFSHILPKGLYPRFRLYAKNVFIVCDICHTDWEFGNRKTDKFDEKRRIAQELKIEYNAPS